MTCLILQSFRVNWFCFTKTLANTLPFSLWEPQDLVPWQCYLTANNWGEGLWLYRVQPSDLTESDYLLHLCLWCHLVWSSSVLLRSVFTHFSGGFLFSLAVWDQMKSSSHICWRALKILASSFRLGSKWVCTLILSCNLMHLEVEAIYIIFNFQKHNASLVICL